MTFGYRRNFQSQRPWESTKLSVNWLVFWQMKTDLPDWLIDTYGFPRLIGRTHHDLSRPIALALRPSTKIRFTSRPDGLAHLFQGHHSWYTKQRMIKKRKPQPWIVSRNIRQINRDIQIFSHALYGLIIYFVHIWLYRILHSI